MTFVQEVNLYRASLSEKGEARGRTPAHLAVAAVLLGVCGYIGFEGWQVLSWRGKLLRASDEYTQMNERVTQMKIQLLDAQTSTEPVSLETLRDRLRKTRQRRLALERSFGQEETGFSQYFSAFARQHQRGLWLTQIDVVGAGSDIVFAGKSIDPTLVPEYVARLAREHVFSGVALQSFRINQPSAETTSSNTYVEFIVSSRPLNNAERR